jgi:membrane carboxypeptidase/penicillin-binding protein PbpC
LAIPLWISHWTKISLRLLGWAIAVGLATYLIQIFTGRIDANPVESFYGAAMTTLILLVFLARQRLQNGQPDPASGIETQ